MSDTYVIEELRATDIAPAPTPATPTQDANNNSNVPKDVSVFALLFYLLLDSMDTRSDTVSINSRQLSSNADVQKMLNERDEQLQYPILPKDATQVDMQRYQEMYQQITAQHTNIQAQMITARQDAQEKLTDASSNVNMMQQDASEDSAYLKTLNAVFDVIVNITNNQ